MYHLGCPVWACADWQGSLFKKAAPRTDWLRQYSSVFNSVEGNSTFYGLPQEKTVQRWARSVVDGFRFSLKFPREVTHDHQLSGGEETLKQFLGLLEILDAHGCLGPSLLQLPPYFDGAKLPVLEQFLDRLGGGFPVAVEVRHLDYFDEDDVERRFEDVLSAASADRALFDSRPLFSEPAGDEIELAAQKRKPRSPYRSSSLGRYPMLRLIGRNDLTKVDPWIDQWAPIVASWIAEGRTPFVFTHAPDDRYAPELAERFHRALQKQVERLDRLPVWPGRGETRQIDLF